MSDTKGLERQNKEEDHNKQDSRKIYLRVKQENMSTLLLHAKT